jgi:hypothetical protein
MLLTLCVCSVRSANRVAAQVLVASPREGIKSADRSRCPAGTLLAVVHEE